MRRTQKTWRQGRRGKMKEWRKRGNSLAAGRQPRIPRIYSKGE